MKKFCHLCGSSYLKGKNNPQVCSGCGSYSFENPVPTVELVLFDDKGRALISERGEKPMKGYYDIPGGFLEINETFEEGAVREIKEELGLLKKDYASPIYIQSNLYNYTANGETRQLVCPVFAAKLLTNKQIQAKDDVASVKFVSVDGLDKISFASPSHPIAIVNASKMLFF